MAPSARALAVALAALAIAACSPTKNECSSGQLICPTGCADPLTDPANCGTCMNACPATATCAGGTCVCRNAGEVVCDGACVPTTSFGSDPANCGGCGIVCGFGTCVGGGCQCEGGLLCADQNPRCVQPLTDSSNCGRCGNVCETALAGSQCVNGACACDVPLPDTCATFCTDFQSDARNCNGCGNVCPLTNDICAGGRCQCPGTLPTTCGDTCVDTLTDPSHCGPTTDPATSCAHVCPLSNDVCVNGTCTCPSSLPDACSESCVDLRTDEQNCGACGVRCPTTATCTGTPPRCECPAAQPVACGSTCCAGTACCTGDVCQTAHDNGLGQTYYDCNPLGTYGLDAAQKAAVAWNPDGHDPGFTLTCVNLGCLGWQTSSQCAVWCYGDATLRGRVSLQATSLVCTCPTPGTPNWN